ncbi:unnamed protein product [Phytomonas sp. Hart1]|nr:unnamed protein product [Phytomonas sp. Hart1]|eukprot:CCW67383.1 unnamed protein product [Phytomonas sp. isolate Hart1]
MSKINATYSSGYYLSPDTDYRKLEEAQRAEQRRKRGRPGEEVDPLANTKRQTFAIPFNLICGHCKRHIARGTHVYTNRRATNQKYLNAIRIWELEIRCRYCQGRWYLHTDPETPKETGGYICARDCQRGEGDFYALNKQNEAVRSEWEKEKAEAKENPLAALERENEAARLLAERNRQIEADVIANAEGDDVGLLAAVRARNSINTFHEGSSSGLMLNSTTDFALSEEEAANEEAEYQRFEAEMRRQWQDQHGGDENEKGPAFASDYEDGVRWGEQSSVIEGPAIARDASELAEALRNYGDGVRFGGLDLTNNNSNIAPENGFSGSNSSTSSSAAQSVVKRTFKNAFILEEEGDKVVDLPTKLKQVRVDANSSVRPPQSSTRPASGLKRPAPRSSLLKNLLDDDDSD